MSLTGFDRFIASAIRGATASPFSSKLLQMLRQILALTLL